MDRRDDQTWLETQPAATPDGITGSTLDRFRLDGVLGRGGMGEVLSGRDAGIG